MVVTLLAGKRLHSAYIAVVTHRAIRSARIIRDTFFTIIELGAVGDIAEQGGVIVECI